MTRHPFQSQFATSLILIIMAILAVVFALDDDLEAAIMTPQVSFTESKQDARQSMERLQLATTSGHLVPKSGQSVPRLRTQDKKRKLDNDHDFAPEQRVAENNSEAAEGRTVAAGPSEESRSRQLGNPNVIESEGTKRPDQDQDSELLKYMIAAPIQGGGIDNIYRRHGFGRGGGASTRTQTTSVGPRIQNTASVEQKPTNVPSASPTTPAPTTIMTTWQVPTGVSTEEAEACDAWFSSSL